MVFSRPEDDLETLIVNLTSDDTVSLALLTKVVKLESIDDVKFELSRVLEEFDTGMVPECDEDGSVWFGKTSTLSDLMMSAA